MAVYAPIKPPDHPIASGDREIARLIVRAIEAAGHRVDIPSKHIAYMKRPAPGLFEQREAEAAAEIGRVRALLGAIDQTERPDVWITYHPYCKAPDWIGPAIATEFGMPYMTVEACRTSRDGEEWIRGRRLTQHCVQRAAVNFCLKPTDFDYLSSFLDDLSSVRRLPPFIDVRELLAYRAAGAPFAFGNGDPVLLSVAMMRPGKKLQCYNILAETLARLPRTDWNLVIVGDGPVRAQVEAAFAFVPAERIRWMGALSRREVQACMQHADIFAWPGLREPIGMVFLEAQAEGLPVAALRSMGVPMVVADGETGLLADEDDREAYVAAFERLLSEPGLRERLAANAAGRALASHDIASASAILSDAIVEATASQRNGR